MYIYFSHIYKKQINKFPSYIPTILHSQTRCIPTNGTYTHNTFRLEENAYIFKPTHVENYTFLLHYAIFLVLFFVPVPVFSLLLYLVCVSFSDHFFLCPITEQTRKALKTNQYVNRIILNFFFSSLHFVLYFFSF